MSNLSGYGSIAPGEPNPSGGGDYPVNPKGGDFSTTSKSDSKSGASKGKTKDDDQKRAFLMAHAKSDVDFSNDSQHHSLGAGPKQAAPGNHQHAWPGELKYLSYEPTEIPYPWIAARGGTALIADHPNLFAVYGTTYGGDGVTTFGIPDFRKRYILGSRDTTDYLTGNNDGLAIGTRNPQGGHTHTIPSAGAHAHGIDPQAGGTAFAAGAGGTNVARFANFDGHTHGGNTGNTGAHTHGGADSNTVGIGYFAVCVLVYGT